MDGFKAFKYHQSIKLHFTNDRFNVFENKGRLRGSYQTFMNRNDHMLFERLAHQYKDKEFIQYCASNFMYGNDTVVYHTDVAMTNYKEYLRRRQSITHVFRQDLQTIVDSDARYNFSGRSVPDVVQLFLAGKITIETMSILNDFDDIVGKTSQQPSLALVLEPTLLRIKKAKGFVKYDPYKTMGIYTTFLEEVKK